MATSMTQQKKPLAHLEYYKAKDPDSYLLQLCRPESSHRFVSLPERVVNTKGRSVLDLSAIT
jgi:hypothetical protein